MSEYLSDEEQVERLKSWWNENGTFLVVGLLVTIVAIGGWNYYGIHGFDNDLWVCSDNLLATDYEPDGFILTGKYVFWDPYTLRPTTRFA